MKAFPLPGATGHVTLDYLAYDQAHGRVWIPVGETGSVDVFDTATGTFTRVDGFKTSERDVRGTKRTMGPSAVSIGDGVAYIGDRASGEVCVIDEKTLMLGACLKLPVAIDGVSYVAAAKEVWVTTPRDHAIAVLDASKPLALKAKTVIAIDGEPEGYAIDAARGLFYTNAEDKDRTLAIDIATHAVKTTWSAGCGAEGPRGIAVDGARNFILVACTDGLRVLDGAHGGASLGRLDAGGGVDNFEYLEPSRTVAIAAGRASRLTVARIDDKGQPSVVTTTPTAEGARNAVVDANGSVYVVDPQTARLLVFKAP
ncbi:MAG: family beta-propeller repeat protein [Myxococcaceae bacterium]|nr:family beta-propeller repeat protein [Myxococcaceae bacterium]